MVPLGYGDMSFVHNYSVWKDPAAIDHNTDLFTSALLNEVLPRVESEYRVSKDRNDRAIVGLSMGGLESLEVGLTHTGQFAWVGGFSSAVHALDYTQKLASLDPKTANLRLLWIACGTEDSLIEPNRKLVAFLKTKEHAGDGDRNSGPAHLAGLARQPDSFHTAALPAQIICPDWSGFHGSPISISLLAPRRRAHLL